MMEEFERREERRDGIGVGQVKKEGESRLTLMLIPGVNLYIEVDFDVNIDVNLDVNIDDVRWGWSWTSEERGKEQVHIDVDSWC